MPEILLNQAQAAALAGLSLRHFSRLLSEAGAPPRIVAADGKFQGLPVAPFRRWLFGRIAAELGNGEALSPPAEKARLDKLRGDAVQLELDRKRGLLLPVDEISRVWGEQVMTAKHRLLALPARVAPSLLRMTDLREVESFLRDSVYEILTELASSARCYGRPNGTKVPALADDNAALMAD